MRALVLAAAVIATVSSAAPARAEGGPFGLGLILGKPTGVTGAYKLGDSTAIDGAVGIDLIDGERFWLHADFLFLLPDLLGGGSVALVPYLGPGAFISDLGRRDGSRLGIGAHVPFGLNLDFRRAPLQIFGEVAVIVPLIPDPDVGLGGAIGFRYYF